MRIPSSSFTRATCLLILTTSVSLAGCEKPMGTVVGTVTHKGQPVVLGQVELYAKESGSVGTGKLDAAGNFTLDVPLPLGEYTARVFPAWDEPGNPAPRRKATTEIPKKAQEFNTSGLTVTVCQGPNTVTLDLKD